MEKNKIDNIFFDLDHTIWDFEKNSSITFSKLLVKYKIDVNFLDFLKVYKPINFKYWKLYREEKISKEFLRHNRLKSAFDELRINVSTNLIDKISNDYIRFLPENNFLIKNSIKILDYLKTKYDLHIITNGFTDVQNKTIKNSGLKDYFINVIDSETVGVKKPNPKIFHYALNITDGVPEKSLMIGDSLEADILGSLNCGFKAIHLIQDDEPSHKHCRIIKDLKELEKIL